jgi:CubicO group peptidase (beta-lactamase class C family)
VIRVRFATPGCVVEPLRSYSFHSLFLSLFVATSTILSTLTAGSYKKTYSRPHDPLQHNPSSLQDATHMKRAILLTVLFSTWLNIGLNAEENEREIPSVTNEGLEQVVSRLRNERKLVGLGAMIMVDGKTIATAVDGERKKGSGVSLDVGDRWHIGSITKSVTATMIARLVEKEKMTWSMTVGECFGEAAIHADWQAVTLNELLTHTSGAPANFPVRVQFKRPPEGRERMDARREAVLAILKKKPGSKPGESFKYSNVGFTVAGAMAEKETETSWEDLVRKEVIAPLNLTQVGFGPPRDDKQALDQPRGHQKVAFFKRAVGVEDDNSPIIGPAGTIHMTLGDLCTFGNEHMLGANGKGKLLNAQTYRHIHTAKLNDYAFGLVVPKENSWARQRVIWHNGSNTMWYALLVLLPESNAVIGVATNDGDIANAEAAAFDIVQEFADQL